MILSVSVSMRKSAVFIYGVPSFFGSEGGYDLVATSRATSRLSSDEYLLTYSDQHGEVLGRQRFRVLRFKPAN